MKYNLLTAICVGFMGGCFTGAKFVYTWPLFFLIASLVGLLSMALDSRKKVRKR